MKHLGDGQLAVFESPEEAIRFAHSFRTDVVGIGVHIASRVMGEAEPSQILVSRTVRDLVAGSDIAFEDLGSYQLKGLDGDWQLFAVSDT